MSVTLENTLFDQSNGIHTHCRNATKDPTEADASPRLEKNGNFFVAGGTVHMVCRNKDKAEEARADVVKETGNKVKPRLSRPFQNQTFVTPNVITGSPRPHPGPVGDQEGLGICGGL